MEISRPSNPAPVSDEEEVTYLDLIRVEFASMIQELDANPRVDKSSMYYRHFVNATPATLIAGVKYFERLIAKSMKLGYSRDKAMEKVLYGVGIKGLLPEDYIRISDRLKNLDYLISESERDD